MTQDVTQLIAGLRSITRAGSALPIEVKTKARIALSCLKESVDPNSHPAGSDQLYAHNRAIAQSILVTNQQQRGKRSLSKYA